MVAIEPKNLSEFSTVLLSNTFVFADFYAPWCGPCQSVAPFFSQMASTHTKKGKIAFVKVNTDECTDIASRYAIRRCV